MTAPSGFSVTSGAPPLFAARIALVFCAPMMVNGIALPFFPVWLETLEMSGFQIGIVLCSAAVITNIMGLALAAIGVGVLGIALTGTGIFMPELLHNILHWFEALFAGGAHH